MRRNVIHGVCAGHAWQLEPTLEDRRSEIVKRLDDAQ